MIQAVTQAITRAVLAPVPEIRFASLPLPGGNPLRNPALCLLALVFALAGCVPYPIHKTLQPAAMLTVQDTDGHPLQDARVTLISSARPSRLAEKSRETRTSNALGQAVFESRKEWRAEVLALHGSEEYSWRWCVEKPGFATYVSDPRPLESFVARPVVSLTKGLSGPCSASFSGFAGTEPK